MGFTPVTSACAWLHTGRGLFCICKKIMLHWLLLWPGQNKALIRLRTCASCFSSTSAPSASLLYEPAQTQTDAECITATLYENRNFWSFTPSIDFDQIAHSHCILDFFSWTEKALNGDKGWTYYFKFPLKAHVKRPPSSCCGQYHLSSRPRKLPG